MLCFKDNTNDSPDIGDIAVNKIILTTASPFKITNYNDTTTKEKTEPCNLLPLTSSSLQSFTTDSLIGNFTFNLNFKNL